MKLIVGLGNPGKEYENTRHNIGFKVIDAFIHKHNIFLKKNKYTGKYFKNKKFIILKPQTFMNASGECVFPFVKFFKIKLEDILIIHDDLDTLVGKAKIKTIGSDGGHNGLKDILHKFNTRSIPRLKVGIGRAKNNVQNYVLGNFTLLQIQSLNKIKDNLVETIETFINENVDKAATKINSI